MSIVCTDDKLMLIRVDYWSETPNFSPRGAHEPTQPDQEHQLKFCSEVWADADSRNFTALFFASAHESNPPAEFHPLPQSPKWLNSESEMQMTVCVEFEQVQNPNAWDGKGKK